MDILAENEGKIYARAAVDGQTPFAPPFSGVPFPCLIWDYDGCATDAARSAIAKALLDAGCRYAVCAGKNCEAWHDAVDAELVLAHLHESDEVTDPAMVLTTWHEGEGPDEVAFFFVLNTNYGDHDFRRYLVLHVGTGTTQKQVDTAVRKYALGDSAVSESMSL